MHVFAVVLLLAFVTSSQAVDCNACTYNCRAKWPDLSCPHKKELCKQTRDLFATFVNHVERTCNQAEGRFSHQDRIEDAKTLLDEAGIMESHEFNGMCDFHISTPGAVVSCAPVSLDRTEFVSLVIVSFLLLRRSVVESVVALAAPPRGSLLRNQPVSPG